MAEVTGKQSYKIDELFEASIISGEINASGHLILETRSGALIDAGFVTRPSGEPWSAGTAYKTGDVAGYAGQLWRARSDHTAKVPIFFNSYWMHIAGRSMTGWPERDPYFDGDDLNESWDFSTKTGTSSVSLTTNVGEFETGKQALKISLSAASSQRFYQKDENNVKGGDKFTATVRAKLVSASAGAKLQGFILQNDATAAPIPGASGLTSTVSAEGDQVLTTAFATYTFTFTAVNAKARAMIDIVAASVGAGAVVCVDWVRIDRYVAPVLPPGATLAAVLVYTTNGTFTKASYPGLKYLKVKGCGAGGSGAGAPLTAAAQSSLGLGGTSSGYGEVFVLAASLGASVFVGVPVGEVGTTGAGTSGGAAAFGSFLILPGGNPGTQLAAGTALGFFSPPTPPSPGSGGDINLPGQTGAFATRQSAAVFLPGSGGDGYLGTGGIGRASASSDGAPGTGYGAGGGGAGNAASQSARPGGNSAPGVIIVEVYV